MKFQDAIWTIHPTSENLQPPDYPLRLRAFRWLGRQVWIPRGQDWLLRQLWNPGRTYPFEVDFFGYRYPGDLAQYLDWNVFAYRSYAYNELSLLDILVQELRKKHDSITFLDIGANVGHHTLFMAGRVDKVIAVEPFPALQQLIQQKITVNQIAHVQLAPFAIGESEAALQYYPGGGGNSGSGTFIPESIGTYQHPVEVQIKNGDQAVDELNPGPIHVYKVDVEGFEPQVFRGLGKRIQADRPVILTEMSDRSREGFGSIERFKACFWDGAIFAEVGAKRRGHPFHLLPFDYENASEVLILPPEMADFARSYLPN